ncbi:hypothetical protein CJ030_MR7G000079 [Morella rubra]|uniref:Uncharacterized protein n=1 Tax=Morella rubra TaxID=262757 RepID=A0A6A1V1D3_9ROSI|nr:hypothetical protein CJ030_MR7G000079 [Morella rubra]
MFGSTDKEEKGFVESGGINAGSEMASPIGAAYIDSLFGLEVPWSRQVRRRRAREDVLRSDQCMNGHECYDYGVGYASLGAEPRDSRKAVLGFGRERERVRGEMPVEVGGG